jgi:hypothetical protein
MYKSLQNEMRNYTTLKKEGFLQRIFKKTFKNSSFNLNHFEAN